MNTKELIIGLLLVGSVLARARDNRVLLPPFENLSNRRAPTEYEISAGGISSRLPTRNAVDRYSHIPREILEDIVSDIKGVSPVERQRLDQFFLETGLKSSQPLVDGEKAKLAMMKLNAPTAIQGTILSIAQGVEEYDGYVRVKQHRWVANIRVRIYQLSGGTLEIPYSRLISGEFATVETSYTKGGAGDDTEIVLALLRNVLEQLREDPEFEAAVRGRSGLKKEYFDENLIPIPIDVLPDGADVNVNDLWQGKTPCEVRLESEKEALIKIEKHPEYRTWQAKILPRRGFRVNRDLEKLPSSK